MPEIDSIAWSPYAPLRWRDELWWTYGRLAAKEGLVTATGQIASTLPEMIQGNLIAAMMAGGRGYLETLPADDRGHIAGQMLAKFMEMRHWVPLVGQYEANGRQIFDLHDALSEALLHTDVGDCSMEGLSLPYDCFFLAFGKQAEIRVPWEDDFEYADGAFVAVTPWDCGDGTYKRRYKIGLSTVKKDGSGVMMPGYFLDFTPDEALMPVQQAIDVAISRRKAAFLEGTNAGPQDHALASHRIADLEDGAILARKALLLVFNAMFYLESLHELPSESPGRDTSSSLSAKWSASAPAKRHKVKSELTANGYAVVRLVGAEVAGDAAAAKSRTDGVRTHWRRGFFRMQAHGPAMTLRKRLWVRPTVVNASKDSVVDTPGHIYIPGGNSAH